MFSKRLRYLIEQTNINQSKLGREIGYSPQAISSWCRGEGEPNCETIKKIAEYFEVSTDFLLGLEKKYDDFNIGLKCEILRTELIENGYLKEDEKFGKKDLKLLMNFLKMNEEVLKVYIKHTKF